MKRHDDAERRVSSWLDDEAWGELPDWVLQQTFERTRQEGQRQGLRGRLASIYRRNGTQPHRRSGMFFTAPLAAVLATAALAISAILGVSLTQNEPSPPAAEAVVVADDASNFFQGTSRVLNYADFGEKTVIEDGLVLEELRGQVYEGVVETTDDRITGEMTGTFNQDTHLMPPDWVQPAITQWGTERIVNDGGAWQCTWSGGEMQFMAQQRLMWCLGEGGYDGYAMRMMWTRNADGTIDVMGLAWQGVLPPLPNPTQP